MSREAFSVPAGISQGGANAASTEVLLSCVTSAKPSVLALDFDGVIWDTQRECYMTAQEVWYDRFGRWAQCPEQLFLSGRWLARRGEEFALILEIGETMCLEVAPEAPKLSDHSLKPWCKDDWPAPMIRLSLQDYSLPLFMELSRKKSQTLAESGRQLVEKRIFLREEHTREWMDCQGPFPGVREAISKLAEKFNYLSICTTKDKASALALLRTIDLQLPIISKEYSLDKRQQLQHLAEITQVSPTQIMFVDDVLDNLKSAQELGVRPVLAAWGYNSQASRQEAAALGFPVISSLKALQGLI